jgi:hypothetical protein
MHWRPQSPLRSAVTVVLTLLSCTGCQGSLPTEPEHLTTGIVVYEGDHYNGESGHITSDISDLSDFTGPCEHDDPFSADPLYNWEDCISSVRVAPGWRATLYRDTGYESDSLEITGDVPDLERVYGHCWKGGLGDCVSSVRVSKIQ